MPTYDYKCETGHRFELFQRFAEPTIQECPECGASVRRIIHASGVIFKGPGFYKTDNRAKASDDSADSASTESADSKADKPSTDGKKSETKPEKTKATASTETDGGE